MLNYLIAQYFECFAVKLKTLKVPLQRDGCKEIRIEELRKVYRMAWNLWSGHNAINGNRKLDAGCGLIGMAGAVATQVQCQWRVHICWQQRVVKANARVKRKMLICCSPFCSLFLSGTAVTCYCWQFLWILLHNAVFPQWSFSVHRQTVVYICVFRKVWRSNNITVTLITTLLFHKK